MRLFDASMADKLVVPTHIAKLENDLKKEWTKAERAAKQALKSSTASTDVSSKINKRKSVTEDNTSSQPAAKKTKPASAKKTAAVKPTSPDVKASKASGSRATKQGGTPAVRGGSNAAVSSARSRNSVTHTAAPVPPARPIATARRGASSTGRGRGSTQAPSTRVSEPAVSTTDAGPARYRTKQTARRSRPFTAQGGASFQTSRLSQPAYNTVDEVEDDHGPPPPYTEYDDGHGEYDESDIDMSDDSSGGTGDSPRPPLLPLGLLNGRWGVDFPYAEQNYGAAHHGGYFLIFTLQGNRLWANFDFGAIEGYMLFNQRPLQSSDEPVPYVWRGEETGEVELQFGRDCVGEVTFFGGGYLEGVFAGSFFGNGEKFSAQRLGGNQTRSEIDARTMQMRFNEINADEYERRRVSRWH